MSKELTNSEYNDKIWSKVRKLQDDIEKLKSELKPCELPKQATLAECNALARKIKQEPAKINPKVLAQEGGFNIKD